VQIYFLAIFEEKLNKFLNQQTLAGYPVPVPLSGWIPDIKKAGLSGRISGASLLATYQKIQNWSELKVLVSLKNAVM
jgi:hypothetical protein